MITINQIYSIVESEVNTADRPVYCASVIEPIPAKFPACQIVEMGHSNVRSALTLNFHKQDSVSVTRDFEAHVFSDSLNKALSEARSIMNDVEIAFRKLGFIETFCGQAANADPAIVHMVGRFTRVFADGDQLNNE